MIDSELSSIFKSCADSIRSKGVSGTFLPTELSSGISQIQTGGQTWEKKDWYEDGKTHLWLRFSPDDNISDWKRLIWMTLYLSSTNMTSVDWGDGQLSTLSSATLASKSISHTYISADDYEITIDGYDRISVSLQCLGGANGWDAKPNGARTLKQIEIDLKGGKLTNATPYNDCNFVKVIGSELLGFNRICTTFYNLKEYENDGCSALNEYSFLNACGIEKVDMPNLIHTGEGIFRNCKSLSSFTCSPDISSLGRNIFNQCPNLRLDLQNQFVNLKSLGANAFYQCSCLTGEINLENVRSLENGQATVDGIFAGTQISSITGMQQLTSIGNLTLANSNLVTIPDLPNFTGNIGSNAMLESKYLRRFYAPQVTYVGNDAFGYCYSMSSLTLGELSRIGYWYPFRNIGISCQTDDDGIKSTITVGNTISSFRNLGVASSSHSKFPYSAPTTTKFVCSDGYIKYVNNQWTDFYT